MRDHGDALISSLWASVGAFKAITFGLPVLPTIMMGVFTATGGSMIRDVLIGREPAVFGNNQPTVVPAIAGAVVTLIGVNTGHLALGAVAGPLTSFTISMIAYYRDWRVPTSPQFAPVNTTASQLAAAAKRGVHKIEPERVRDWRHATLSRVQARELSDNESAPGTREDAETRVAAYTGGNGFGFDKDGTSYADSAPAVDQKEVHGGGSSS